MYIYLANSTNNRNAFTKNSASIYLDKIMYVLIVDGV